MKKLISIGLVIAVFSSSWTPVQAVCSPANFFRERIFDLPLPDGRVQVTLVDKQNGFAYLGTRVRNPYSLATNPGTVIKVDLRNFRRVATLSLSGAGIETGVLDPGNQVAYFVSNSPALNTPVRVVKVNVNPSNFSEIAYIDLPSSGSNEVTNVESMVIGTDSQGRYLLLGTDTQPGKLVKVRANPNDFRWLSTVTLPAGQNRLVSAALYEAAQADGGGAYFSLTSPAGSLLRVNPESLSYSLQSIPGYGADLSIKAIDGARGLLYFWGRMGERDTRFVKYDLKRAEVVSIQPMIFNPRAVALDSTGTFAYSVEDGTVEKIRLQPEMVSELYYFDEDLYSSGRFEGVLLDQAGRLFTVGYIQSFGMDGFSTFYSNNAQTLAREQGLEFSEGFRKPTVSVVDPANGFAYVAVEDPFAKVAKIRLSDFTIVGSGVLDKRENLVKAATIDRKNGFAYFSMANKIKKVNLASLEVEAELEIPIEFGRPTSIAFNDSEGINAYFGTTGQFGATGHLLVKVNLSKFEIEGDPFDVGKEHYLKSAVIDRNGAYAYLGVRPWNGFAQDFITKIDLSIMAPEGPSLELGSGQSLTAGAVIDPQNAYAYFFYETLDLHLLKVDLSDFSAVTSVLAESSVQEPKHHAVIDEEGCNAYFMTDRRVLKFQLSPRLGFVGSIGFQESVREQLTDTSFLDPINERLYVGFNRNGYGVPDLSQIIKLDLRRGPPQVTVNPENQTVREGQTARFSIYAIRAEQYQWKKKAPGSSQFIPIPGANSFEYAVEQPALADSGAQFLCTVQNVLGTADSSAATLTVTPPPAPTIDRHPEPLNAREGEPAGFSVSASGSNLRYQWKKKPSGASQFIPIDGATSSDYRIQSAAHTDHEAQFLCTVSNNGGSIDSRAALLTVQVQSPEIVRQPQPQAILAGQTATFSIGARGNRLQYQWKQKPRNGTQFESIPGATADTYTTPALPIEMNGTRYLCTVRNEGGAVDSQEVELTVYTPLRIVTHPVSQTRNVGQSVTLSVSVGNTGLGRIFYTWRKDDTVVLSGYDANALSVAAVGTDHAGRYTCTMNDRTGTVVTSNPADLTVNSALQISGLPNRIATNRGRRLTFGVAVTGGTSPYAYQWKKNGVDIPNATAASLTLTAVAASDAGEYKCQVKDGTTIPAESNAVSLVINEPLRLTTQPSGRTRNAGQRLELSVVVANGTPPYTYQWKRGNDTLPNSNAALYVIESLKSSDAGRYRCVITDAAGDSLTSNDAVVIVNASLQARLDSESTLRLAAGQALTLPVVTSGGTAPFHYQWKKGETILSGVEVGTLVLSSLSPSDGGIYRCIVTDANSQSFETPPVTVVVSGAQSAAGNSSINVVEGRAIPSKNQPIEINVPNGAQVKVYNKLNQLVHATTVFSPPFSWTGGEEPSGAYIFYITKDGMEEITKGVIVR